MSGRSLIGKWVHIERTGWDGTPQHFFGLCEWASEDARNFRLAGIGHLGLTRADGTVTEHAPTND